MSQTQSTIYVIPEWVCETVEGVVEPDDTDSADENEVAFIFSEERSKETHDKVKSILHACRAPFVIDILDYDDGNILEWHSYTDSNLNLSVKRESKLGIPQQEEMIKLAQEGRTDELAKLVISNCSGNIPPDGFSVSESKPSDISVFSMALFNKNWEECRSLLITPSERLKTSIKNGLIPDILDLIKADGFESILEGVKLTSSVTDSPGAIQVNEIYNGKSADLGWSTSLALNPALLCSHFNELVKLLYPLDGWSAFHNRVFNDIEWNANSGIGHHILGQIIFNEIEPKDPAQLRVFIDLIEDGIVNNVQICSTEELNRLKSSLLDFKTQAIETSPVKHTTLKL